LFNEGLKGDLMVDGHRHGLVLDIGGHYKNVITLAPAFIISEDEIDLGIELLERLLTRCGAT
jgi:4-aminobutyrate aminotransferase-like enzyme